MIDHPNTLLAKMQFLLAGILLIAILFLLSFLPPAQESNRVQAEESKNASSGAFALEMSDSPNAVTSGLITGFNELGRAADSTIYAVNAGAQSVASATAQGSKAAARGAAAAARGVGNALLAAGRTAGKGIGFVGNMIGDGVSAALRAPGNAISSISNTSAVRGVIRPSEHAQVPIIDPDSPELQTALAALPAKPGSGNKSHKDAGPAWPIHGRITTHFGVAHWPFQPTHTGLDISDGKAAGVTPIKPFRPGRVIDTVHSYYGLGNHVIVDHGNGVTSVYAHLNSISVRIGQKVGMNTVLGFEGSTGLSTGPHLHFEIRVNGQATDPRQFISGHP